MSLKMRACALAVLSTLAAGQALAGADKPTVISFGGGTKADKAHFADGGSFDQIYLSK